jgi:cytochrome c biogenesis protein CcmG/thiol:disulfide interchange protein DsbE
VNTENAYRDEPAPRGRRPLVLALQASAVALVAGLLALLVWRVVVRNDATGFVSDIADGKRPAAPAFALNVIWDETQYWPRSLRPALADGELSLAELRGHPVVLNFWASWCGPCRDEAPVFAASARAHAGLVVFVGVDVQDFTSDARGFLRKYTVPYVAVRDGGGSVYADYGLTGVPETYYLDARGRAVAHSPGAVDRGDLEAGVRAATG